MTWGLVAVAGSSLVGGLISSGASKDASQAQLQAADKSAQVQQDIFNKQVELQAPFREAGLSAQNRLLRLLGLRDEGFEEFNKYGRDFSMDDFVADPGYAFRLSEGNKALDRQAAARGGLISGAALKAATRYGQEMGSQEYQNAFNRYQINRANQLNPLQSLMGGAQTGATTLTNAAGNLGQGLSSTYEGAGNARASGYVGAANAWNNAISSGVNNFLDYKMLSGLGGGGGGALAPVVSTPMINLAGFR